MFAFLNLIKAHCFTDRWGGGHSYHNFILEQVPESLKSPRWDGLILTSESAGYSLSKSLWIDLSQHPSPFWYVFSKYVILKERQRFHPPPLPSKASPSSRRPPQNRSKSVLQTQPCPAPSRPHTPCLETLKGPPLLLG